MVRNRDSAFGKYRTFNILNPIVNSTHDGVFALSTTSLEKYKSNLYTLIFTGVGERVMEPNFGTIIKYLLFEPMSDTTYEKITQDVVDKASIWVPEIAILGIDFGDKVSDAENNRITIRIDFALKLDPTIQDFIEIEMGT